MKIQRFYFRQKRLIWRKKSKAQKKLNTIILLLIVTSIFCFGCKKDECPSPGLPENFYQMQIEVTDNEPFGDAAILCAFGDDTFLTGNGIADEDSTEYLFIGTDSPVYSERIFNYRAADTTQIYFWIITSGSAENWYSVEVFKNGISFFKSAGYTMNYEKQSI